MVQAELVGNATDLAAIAPPAVQAVSRVTMHALAPAVTVPAATEGSAFKTYLWFGIGGLIILGVGIAAARRFKG